MQAYDKADDDLIPNYDCWYLFVIDGNVENDNYTDKFHEKSFHLQSAMITM